MVFFMENAPSPDTPDDLPNLFKVRKPKLMIMHVASSFLIRPDMPVGMSALLLIILILFS